VKKLILATFLCLGGHFFALQAGTPPSSTSNTLYQERLKAAQKAQTQPQKPKQPTTTPQKTLLPPAQPLSVSEEGLYTDPGIVAFQDGKWVGSDHLYNISSNISINVEVVKPPNFNINITEAALKERIAAIFRTAGITPQAEPQQDLPPLPLFHMIVFIYPIPNGIVACCDGRLFEAVTLDRVRLQKGVTWQAITWNKQNLLVSALEQGPEQINQSVDTIATLFTDRYKYFLNLKMQIDKQSQ